MHKIKHDNISSIWRQARNRLVRTWLRKKELSSQLWDSKLTALEKRDVYEIILCVLDSSEWTLGRHIGVRSCQSPEWTRYRHRDERGWQSLWTRRSFWKYLPFPQLLCDQSPFTKCHEIGPFPTPTQKWSTMLFTRASLDVMDMCNLVKKFTF